MILEKPVHAFLLTVFMLGLVGCSKTDSIDEYIDQVIQGGMSVKSDVLNDPLILDYDVHRERNGIGIVFSYKVDNDVVAGLEADRAGAKAGFVSDPDVQEIVSKGVSVRFEYEAVDGAKVDFNITPADYWKCFILDAEMILQTHGGCPEAEWECSCRWVATAKYSFGGDAANLVVTIGALVNPPERCISCAARDYRLEVVATCMAMLRSFAMNQGMDFFTCGFAPGDGGYSKSK